uniref:Cysteine-rich transmembrane CYSTM domain-containing protein n=1 Tax=Leersia perrieri TaxID=77586 RepID=A0A0D9W9F4_9ORYZ
MSYQGPPPGTAAYPPPGTAYPPPGQQAYPPPAYGAPPPVAADYPPKDYGYQQQPPPQDTQSRGDGFLKGW